jgi:shikimate 5-dehydrogenase
MTDPGVSLLGLVGQGIQYSLSPLIHATSAKYLGVAASYTLYDMKSLEAARAFIAEAWQQGFTGLNLTQPWKRAFNGIPVNTLYRDASLDSWSATSTDGAGFVSALSRIGCNPKAISRLIFLGAGAVVDTLIETISSEIGRTPEVHCILRNKKVVAAKNQEVHVHDWSPESLGSLISVECPGTLVVQATPAPLKGDKLHAFARQLARVSSPQQFWISDLCYGKVSALIDEANARGLVAQDGLTMLIEQARFAQKLWWGQSAPFHVIEEACIKAASQR